MAVSYRNDGRAGGGMAAQASGQPVIFGLNEIMNNSRFNPDISGFPLGSYDWDYRIQQNF